MTMMVFHIISRGQFPCKNNDNIHFIYLSIIFVIGFLVLRRWKPNPLWVMAGSGVAGIILYSLV